MFGFSVTSDSQSCSLILSQSGSWFYHSRILQVLPWISFLNLDHRVRKITFRVNPHTGFLVHNNNFLFLWIVLPVQSLELWSLSRCTLYLWSWVHHGTLEIRIYVTEQLFFSSTLPFCFSMVFNFNVTYFMIPRKSYSLSTWWAGVF